MAKFIRIIEWDEYQHYKDRDPPWIKLHRKTLSSRTWVTLDDASRVLAVACMLLAAATGNKIPADPAYLRRVAYLHKDPKLEPLVEVGFIELIDETGQTLADASKPYHLPANACSESEESRAETEKINVQFEKFYEAYPRKQKRKEALKAFRSALAKATDAEIMAGLARYVLTKPDYQDWAMPASWLTGERWNDVPHAGPKPTVVAPKFGPKAFVPTDSAAVWPLRVAGFRKNGFWSTHWGPKPGESDCNCPAEFLKETA